MADKQTQAMQRLLKKLTALRKALPKAERDILDAIVLGATAEVIPHGLLLQKATTSKIVLQAKPTEPEVEAHRLLLHKTTTSKATQTKQTPSVIRLDHSGTYSISE